jgi:hypothetical protein
MMFRLQVQVELELHFKLLGFILTLCATARELEWLGELTDYW